MDRNVKNVPLSVLNVILLEPNLLVKLIDVSMDTDVLSIMMLKKENTTHVELVLKKINTLPDVIPSLIIVKM